MFILQSKAARKFTLRENAELLKGKEGGTYNYQCALKRQMTSRYYHPISKNGLTAKTLLHITISPL